MAAKREHAREKEKLGMDVTRNVKNLNRESIKMFARNNKKRSI